MANRKFGLIFILLSLIFFLASCGDQGVSPPDTTSPVISDGTLELEVIGVDQADVLVAGEKGTIFSGAVAGNHSMSVAAGTYSVDGQPSSVSNMLDPSVQSITVKAGETTKVVLIYEPQVQDPIDNPGPRTAVASVMVETVTDPWGEALPFTAEVNKNKEVDIYAIQTEENVCVRVKAVDASGSPVAGAKVSVTVSEEKHKDDRMAIIRGCSVDGAGISLAAFRDDLMTDGDGVAHFTMRALYGINGSEDIAVSGLSPQLIHDFFHDGEVARVTVAAENEDATNASTEFKVAPYNLAHLYFRDMATGQRVGYEFDRFYNIFDPNIRRGDDRLRNVFDIETNVYEKQPQKDSFPGAFGFVCYFVEGAGVIVENYDDIIDVEKGEVFVDEPTGPDSCYLDFDGYISIRVDETLTAADMPVTAKVHAVLYTWLSFGDYDYFFPLKDYHVTKTWLSTVLTIDKMVDHHVLTWYGDNLDLIDGDDDSDFDALVDNDGEIDYTLDPANAVPADSVFTATFTITTENTGTEPAYDVTLRDNLPAELGVIEESFTDGGSYNSINHSVTWYIGTMDPGDKVSRSFQVYLRQKPGFCVDFEDLLASVAYSYPFNFYDYLGGINGEAEEFDSDDVERVIGLYDGIPCYYDPYDVINGYELDDVTAAYFAVEPAPAGFQQMVDFNGAVYKDQVIIWGVRPLFDIDKTLRNVGDLPFELGYVGIFDIDVTNYDRTDPLLAGVTANGFDVYTADYGNLAAWYPDEFDGSSRDNPYARDVVLSDIFLLGLDYTTASPLTTTDDEGIAAAGSYDAIFIGDPNNPPPTPFAPYLIDFGDKAVVWETVPLMGGGDTADAELKLNNNLPGYHVNHAALTAGNMNQGIDIGDCEREDLLTIGLLIADEELGVNFGPRFSFILDCAEVLVIPAFEPWLELSSVGNGFELDEEVVFEETKFEGDTFFYIFYVENDGDETAVGATLDVALDNANAEIIGASAFAGPVGGPYPPAPFASSSAAGVASFGPYDHPAGFGAYFVIEAVAKNVGNNSAEATVDWAATPSDTQYPLLPFSVTETVSIKPAR